MSRDDRRLTQRFLGALALYFLAQLVLRLVVGGALETDEAEMVLLTPGVQLGYGPQLPLYSWLQAGSFALFGHSVLALALLKNLMLWSCYAMIFAAAAIWLPVRQAILAALSWALLPDVFWEAQRATTHSVALMMMSAATLWSLSALIRRPDALRYGLAGLVLGLGGLSKFNYWFVPLSLALAALMRADTRAQLGALVRRRAVWLVPGVMALVLALPVWWMVRHADLAFASSGKLTSVEITPGQLPWLSGLAEAGQGLVAVLLPLALAIWLIGWAPRRGAAPAGTDDGSAARNIGVFLMRAGGVLLGLFALMVIGAGATHVASRWLLPGFLLIAPGAVLCALAGRGWALRRLGWLALVLAGLTLIGMAEARLRGTARGALDLVQLEAALAPVAPESAPILADFYLGGNLAWRHPDWQIQPFLPLAAPPAPGEEVVLVMRGPAGADALLRAAGWPDALIATLQETARVEPRIPYRFSDDEGLAIRALRLRRPL